MPTYTDVQLAQAQARAAHARRVRKINAARANLAKAQARLDSALAEAYEAEEANK